MKKKVLVVAVTTLLAIPFAAQSETTLFGHAHLSVDVLEADGAADQEDGALAMANNSSRIGIKGSHKFSDSLKGIYHMEWGVGLDGEKDLNQRNRTVGLKGGFGTVMIGRSDTPMKIIGRKADLFWSTQLGQNRTLTNVKDGGNGFDARFNNFIGYISPKVGPLHIHAAYVTDRSGTASTGTVSEDNDQSAWSVAAILGGKKTSYFFAVAMEEHSKAGAVGSESALRVAGTYKFGAIKLAGFYQATSDAGFTAGADRDVIGGGASYKAGSNTFKIAHYIAGDLGAAENTGASLTSIGMDRALSKSTGIYVNYAILSNDDNAKFKLGGSGHGETAAPVAGGDASGLSAGIRIKF